MSLLVFSYLSAHFCSIVDDFLFILFLVPQEFGGKSQSTGIAQNQDIRHGGWGDSGEKEG